MRKDIASRIIIDKNLGGEGTSGAIFKSYVDKATLGQWLLDSYLAQRVLTDETFKITKNGTHRAFFNDSKDEEVGYLSDIYGYVGVLSIAMRMGVKLTKEQKEDITDNIALILDSIEEYGYTLYPYITDAENRCEDGGKLFGRKAPYVGAMTWALSFFTSVRGAVKEGLITLDEARQEAIISNIKKIVEFFNRAFIRHGDTPMGWGYTEGCINSSLFFTYSVLEAYSDFEDNVFEITYINDEEFRTVKDEELLAAINKGRAEGDRRLEEEWREKCYAVSDHVWEVYKDVLKDDFVDDAFLRNFRVVKRDDILKSERSNALFNNIYLVSILLYGYVNRRAADKDDVVMTMEAALQNVQRVYNQLRRDGLEYLVDTYIIPFKSLHIDRKGAYQRLNYKTLVDASLMPMLVKANNIIAYYISQYPVKQMSVLFEDLFDNMQTGGQWIWENKGYDVKINERYIEAIADFYAYYEDYERDYAEKKNAKDKATKDLIRSEREKERKRVFEDAEAAAESKFRRREQEVRAEYVIENEIRRAIEGGVIGTFTAMVDSISKKLKTGEELSEIEAKLYTSLEGFIGAFVTKLISDTVVDKASLETVLKNVKTDSTMFLAEWTERLSASEEVITKLVKGDK